MTERLQVSALFSGKSCLLYFKGPFELKLLYDCMLRAYALYERSLLVINHAKRLNYSCRSQNLKFNIKNNKIKKQNSGKPACITRLSAQHTSYYHPNCSETLLAVVPSGWSKHLSTLHQISELHWLLDPGARRHIKADSTYQTANTCCAAGEPLI